MDERVDPGGRPSPPTSRAIAMFAIVFVALGLIAAAAWFAGGGPVEQECTADGRVGPNGETFTRDPAQDCRWVDGDGVPLPDQ